jgi:CheY-like chemotaxis protein/anti-sigma regulatory factor (Ser/Thr protein kinase)
VSRFTTGKFRLERLPVDLVAIANQAIETVRPDAEARRITIERRFESTETMNGDPDRLQQVVWNLLSNAVKFAARGTASVRLTKDGRTVCLVVSDTGIGIKAEFLPHVFDRFRQGDATPTREYGGLGIGLAIARDLVELHAGSIRAESAGPGKGATFTVRLPQAEIHPALAEAETAAPSLVGISVLAVDDNLDALEIIDLALKQAGATVRVASSAADALALWREAPSDVLLCDLAMPFVSGFELLSRIRELDQSAGRLTPAIAVTAHATEEQIARSAYAGFQMHVSKPFDAQRLVGAISTARTLV